MYIWFRIGLTDVWVYVYCSIYVRVSKCYGVKLCIDSLSIAVARVHRGEEKNSDDYGINTVEPMAKESYWVAMGASVQTNTHIITIFG